MEQLITMNNSAAVVMITCKKFHQAWDPFFILFKKYWPNCPFNVYMITDYGEHKSANTICLNNDHGFAGNLLTGLNKISEDTIIYFQEDYFFNGKFDNERILNYVYYLKQNHIACIRLAPCPGPTLPWEGDRSLGVLRSGDDYRISTQTAIWDKSFIMSLLVPGETGGDFEIKGTKRITNTDRVLLSVWREQTPTPYYITGIVRGEWQEGAINLLKREGIVVDHIQRIIK